MDSVQEKLQKILRASNMSQESLAARLSVSFVTLNKWVNGKVEPRATAKSKIDLLFSEILGTDEITKTEVMKAKKEAMGKKFSIQKLVSNRELLDKITINLTFHSNATEGSTMTEKDVAAVIFDNKVLKNRTAIEQREAINHQTALNFLLDELSNRPKSFTFTPDIIRSTHLRLTNGIISDAGDYRNTPARLRGMNVALANYIKIPELIELWCDRINEKTSDPINLIALTHAEFERIHPFSDGNGRTGRLLLFIKTLQLGLVPPVINKQRRNAYYKYLEILQNQELSDPLEKFIAEAIVDTAKLIEGK